MTPNHDGKNFLNLKPAWSPSGDEIIFSRVCLTGCAVNQRDLWVVDFASLPPWGPFPPWVSPLPPAPAPPPVQATATDYINEDNPSWREVTGPGDDIVYNVVLNLGDPTETSDIYTFTLGRDPSGNPDPSLNTTPVQLTTSGTADYPSWTPLGDAILYVEMAGLDLEVFQMYPDGSKKKNLTNSPKVWELWAKRRPDKAP